MSPKKLFGVVAGVLLFTACSHSGGLTPSGAVAKTDVAFTVIVPRGASPSAVSPKYVSASTQSIGVAATSSGGTSSTAMANCSGSTCVVNVEASIGLDTFTITLYDGLNGTGNVLSSGSITQSILAGTLNKVNVTFNGQISHISVTATPSTLQSGTSATATLTVSATDADGNQIVAPGSYSTPITLSDSDSSGATQISPTSITGPGQSAVLSYNGAVMSSVTITAAATGIPSASATISFTTPASPTPSPTATPTPAPIVLNPSSLSFLGNAPSDARSVAVSESGYSGSFSVTSTCASIATVTGSGSAFTVTPLAAGTCNATFSNATGQTAVLPITVTVTTGSGQ